PVSTTQLDTNLTNAITRTGNGSSVGVTATASTNVVTVTATTSGSAGDSIAVSTDLSNLTWKNPYLAGGTDAGICSGPSVTWSYDTHTGTGGPITTSPVLSIDGKKVAFIESLSSGSVLHVLKPASSEGTVAAPVVPTQVINSTDSGAS